MILPSALTVEAFSHWIRVDILERIVVHAWPTWRAVSIYAAWISWQAVLFQFAPGPVGM